MNIFDRYTHKLLSALLKHNVKFIVVGGYAFNYHGFRRTPKDKCPKEKITIAPLLRLALMNWKNENCSKNNRLQLL
ncbi:hypothetical protein BH10BAC1_BH10BAC1_09730 [soil metagenome]